MKGKCTFADEFQTLIKLCSSALVGVQKACLEKFKAQRACVAYICFLFYCLQCPSLFPFKCYVQMLNGSSQRSQLNMKGGSQNLLCIEIYGVCLLVIV